VACIATFTKLHIQTMRGSVELGFFFQKQEIKIKWDWFQTLTDFILAPVLPWPFLT